MKKNFFLFFIVVLGNTNASDQDQRRALLDKVLSRGGTHSYTSPQEAKSLLSSAAASSSPGTREGHPAAGLPGASRLDYAPSTRIVISGGRNVLGGGSYYERPSNSHIGDISIDHAPGAAAIASHAAASPIPSDPGSKSSLLKMLELQLSDMNLHCRPTEESLQALKILVSTEDKESDVFLVSLRSLGRQKNAIALELYGDLIVGRAVTVHEEGSRSAADTSANQFLSRAGTYSRAGKSYREALAIYKECLEYYQPESLSYHRVSEKINKYARNASAVRTRCCCYSGLGVGVTIITSASLLIAFWQNL